jgi:curved DNA-binding protein CbpA
MPNHYTTLGLQPGASTDDVKKAYKKLALKHHPDRNRGNEKNAQARFVKIQAAYDAILDPASERPAHAPPSGFGGQTYEQPRQHSSHDHRSRYQDEFKPKSERSERKHGYSHEQPREHSGFDHWNQYQEGFKPESEKSRPGHGYNRHDDTKSQARGRSYSNFGDASSHTRPSGSYARQSQPRQYSADYGMPPPFPEYTHYRTRPSHARERSHHGHGGPSYHEHSYTRHHGRPSHSQDPMDDWEAYGARVRDEFDSNARRFHEDFFRNQSYGHGAPKEHDYFGLGTPPGRHGGSSQPRRDRSYTHSGASHNPRGHSYDTSYETFETHRGGFDDFGKSSYAPRPHNERSQGRYDDYDDYDKYDDGNSTSSSPRQASYADKRRPRGNGSSFQDVSGQAQQVWEAVRAACALVDTLKPLLRRAGHRGSTHYVEKLLDKFSKYKAQSSELEQKAIKLNGDASRESSRWKKENKKISQLKDDLSALDKRVGDRKVLMSEVLNLLEGEVSSRDWERVLRKLKTMAD